MNIEQKTCPDEFCETSETETRREISNEMAIQASATEKLNEVVAKLEKTLESVLSGELEDSRKDEEEITCTKLGGEIKNNNKLLNQVTNRISSITRRIEL